MENSGLGPGDMPAERVLEAERVCDKFEVEGGPGEGGGGTQDLQAKFKLAAEKQLSSLVEWAKHIPHFPQLAIDDQVALLRGGWNELMIAGFAHRSVGIQNGEKSQARRTMPRYLCCRDPACKRCAGDAGDCPH